MWNIILLNVGCIEIAVCYSNCYTLGGVLNVNPAFLPKHIHLWVLAKMIKQFLVFGLFAFSRKVLSIYFLILISLFSDVSSLSCNEGSMMHGMPASLTSHTCKAGVLNCIRIFASKSDKIYRIADANFNQMRRVATPRWLAGVADWTWQEMGVCQVQWGQWSPFSFIAMQWFGSGLPQGIVFDVGDYDHSSVTTCFCGSDLCNTEHWCDGCRASSSSSLFPGLASLAITMALIAWWVFSV